MPALPAVVGIGLLVDTGTVAVRLGSWTAEALFATGAGSAHSAAGTTVVVVALGIDAGAVADDVAGRAPANTLLAARAVLADMTTGAAVVRIGGDVDAGAIT